MSILLRSAKWLKLLSVMSGAILTVALIASGEWRVLRVYLPVQLTLLIAYILVGRLRQRRRGGS